MWKISEGISSEMIETIELNQGIYQEGVKYVGKAHD
jgi:hypothetical protein